MVAREGLVGERKGVTVLFADIFASPTVFAKDSAEDAGVVLDEIFKHMIEAVHH